MFGQLVHGLQMRQWLRIRQYMHHLTDVWMFVSVFKPETLFFNSSTRTDSGQTRQHGYRSSQGRPLDSWPLGSWPINACLGGGEISRQLHSFRQPPPRPLRQLRPSPPRRPESPGPGSQSHPQTGLPIWEAVLVCPGWSTTQQAMKQSSILMLTGLHEDLVHHSPFTTCIGKKKCRFTCVLLNFEGQKCLVFAMLMRHNLDQVVPGC